MGWKDCGSLWVEDCYVDPTGGQTMWVSWVKRTYHVDFFWGQFQGSFCFKNIVDFYVSQHLDFWWLHLGCCVDSCFGALGTDLCRELYGLWSAALLGAGPACSWLCWGLGGLLVAYHGSANDAGCGLAVIKMVICCQGRKVKGDAIWPGGLTTDGCSYWPSGAAAMILFSPPGPCCNLL
ncbi:hypothetical protein R6Q57_011316 [Mikania cordata]